MEHNGKHIGGPCKIDIISNIVDGFFKVKINKGAVVVSATGTNLEYLTRPLIDEFHVYPRSAPLPGK